MEDSSGNKESDISPSVSLGSYSWNEVVIENIPSSTAGSGSVDFHEYRMQRRKEAFRIAALEKAREVQSYHTLSPSIFIHKCSLSMIYTGREAKKLIGERMKKQSSQ